MLDPEVLKMKVADLKRELKLRGLSTVGNKTELQDRLHNSLFEGDLTLEDTAISGEDLLDDEVLTDEDEEKAILSQSDENPLLWSPDSKNTSETSKTSETDITSTKKIVLKRKTSILNLTDSVLTSKENTSPTLEKVMKMSERNPITMDENPKSTIEDNNLVKKAVKVIPELTWQQRLELRAKKFGPNTGTLKTETKSVVTSTIDAEKQLEALKKRAERFGVVAPKMVDVKVAERLQKRKERFGAADTPSNPSETSAQYAEKAKLRIDRFRTTSK